MFIVHYVSYVMCHISVIFFYIKIKKMALNKFDKGVELVGGGSVIKGPTPSSF